MKIIPPIEKKADSVNLMTYEGATKHIYTIFGLPEQDCKFTEECLCGFQATVEKFEISSITVTYDKIAFDVEGRRVFWPIQKHTCTLSPEAEKQLLEKLRK